MPAFTSMVLEAYLGGSWVDITSDWLSGESNSIEWGISGISPLDIMPDIGEAQFVLKNIDGKYYPDGGSPLAGWGFGVKVLFTFTYGTDTKKFLYYVEKINLVAGKLTTAEDRVKVTALDWIKFAESYPVLAPDILENKRADEGIQTLLTAMPQPPISSELQRGVNTFPVIFDGVGMRTTAYTEFSKFVNSEFGAMALLKDATNGEKLKFFNYTSTLAGEVKAHISSGYDDLQLSYGDNIINRAIVTAYPKEIDTEPKVLYSLNKAMPINSGETITFRAKYTDPDGGAKVNAIGSSMLPPEEPGAVDPYMMTLLNFTDGLTDETGRHTWTAGDYTNIFWNDVYVDGYGTTYIPGNILGPYLVQGGYPTYNITAPTSADFEFGSGAFTIGWYEDLINPALGNTAMARDNTMMPPFLLGFPSNEKDMLVYFTSDGINWDIAAGRSLGQVQRGRWTYYEVSRDEDGWFYCFADGKLTDKWYSPLAIKSSTGAWTIGNTRVNDWAWMGFDSFFIKKGQCLHKSDFERPLKNIKPTLDGDYLLNTKADGTGTDKSTLLTVTPSYGSEAVTYTLSKAPGSSSEGYRSHITRLQARGRGVYAYNPIENDATDTTSAEAYGYREINLNQPYQTNVKFGTTVINRIVAQEKDPRTRLESLSFVANKNTVTMSNFLTCDIMDLIHVTDAARGVDNFFFIQKIKFSVQAPDVVRVTWMLKSALDVDAAYPPPVPPTFQGVIGLEDITQLQTMDTITITQDYTNAVTVTLEDITQTQTMGTMDFQQVWFNPVLDNIDNWKNIFLFDEFASMNWFSMNPGLAGVGQLGWQANVDAALVLTGLGGVSIDEHYGIVYIQNTSSGGSGTDGYIALSDMHSPMVKLMQFIVLSEAMIDAGDGCVLGLVDLSGTFEIDGSIKGVYFRREYTETNWQAVTRDAGGVTTTDTGVAFTGSAWYLFEIKQATAGTIQFYINDNLVATHTTHIDTSTGLYPTFGMKDPGSTEAWGVILDYFAMQLAPITQRWD